MLLVGKYPLRVMAYTPKKLRPAHLQIIRLHWQGVDANGEPLTNAAIAMLTGYSPQTVSNVIASDEAQEILAGLQSEVIDTMAQVQNEAQFAAPLIWDNVYKLAFSASDERVKLHANLACLGIAGHVPIKRVVVERESALAKKYEDMSEEEIRSYIAGELAPGNGPDGKILQ